jgi:ATP adenylyltransferase C-terminal domain
VLLTRAEWTVANKASPPAQHLSSYGAYLRRCYGDLTNSLNMRQTDCPVPPSTSTASSSSSRKVGMERSRQLYSTDDTSRSERNALRVRDSQAREEQVQRDQELELPFCDAYNLILTEKWMMVVPRTNGKFENLITVNGLGETRVECSSVE